MNRRIAFRNARLIDPASGMDVRGGLLVENGKIADIGPRLFNDAEPTDPEVINCHGLVLAPGLIDARVFTGEPGAEHRESLESASAAAAAGGDQRGHDPAPMPPEQLPEPAAPGGSAGQLLKELLDLQSGLLQEAGAVAFTDGDRTVANARVLRRALSYAATFNALVIAHAEDPELVLNTSATEGEFATRLGLPASPAIAEAMIVERDIRLVELTGARYHFGQISTRAALDAIAAAKARGLPITCGVSANHLALNELDVGSYYTFRKLRPPLRSEADRAAMAEGVASGIIDLIVSSHEPQGADTKRQPFAVAAAGTVGLETLLPVALAPYHDGSASLSTMLATVTSAPAKLLGLAGGC